MFIKCFVVLTTLAGVLIVPITITQQSNILQIPPVRQLNTFQSLGSFLFLHLVELCHDVLYQLNVSRQGKLIRYNFHDTHIALVV